MGRHRCTVCREVRRNSTRADGRYRAFTAQERTNGRRSRSRRNRHFTAEDFALVDELLCRQWSPKQVAGHLARTGQLAIGHTIKVTLRSYYSFRLHARVCWPGVVTRLSVCAAGVPDAAVLEELADGTAGVCLGDRAYWAPELHARLREREVEMLVPFKQAKSDPTPLRLAELLTT